MFTIDWSNGLKVTLNRLYPTRIDVKMTCLEIGSFEGKGSLMIIDKLCSNPESKLVCVDPWEDVYVKDKNEYKNIDHFFVNQYGRFISNTLSTKKIVPVRGYSDDIVPLLTDRFDFVYIDGDHSPEQVYKDAVMSFDKTNIGGIIVFDDYLWVHDGIKCKDGVDRFLREYSEKIEVLFQTRQVGIRKKFNK
jgi:predicted O-methyltransferase YrrM